MYYTVKYKGPFGFIKPWTAVRDQLTHSQQFLTPSIIKGIELKLFPELLNGGNEIVKIARHKLTYKNIVLQQETVRAKVFRTRISNGTTKTNNSILTRGVLISPNLHLAFLTQEDAIRASTQHICLCRNEDLMLPNSTIEEMSEEEFNLVDGFELIFEDTEDSFIVGYNRFNNASPMRGRIEITGQPIRN